MGICRVFFIAVSLRKPVLMRFSALILFCIPALVQSQSTAGPNDPTASSNVMCSYSYSSTVGYNPTNNIFLSDNQYATASHCDCCDQHTQCLFATGFGFNIPLTATINGVVVEIEKRASPNANIQDNGLKLVKNNVELGTDHASTAAWGMSDQYYSYGSATDLWGSTWTPAEINASGFGVGLAVISYTCFGNGPAATSYIDHIRITVHYTDISTGTIGAQVHDAPRIQSVLEGIHIQLSKASPIEVQIYDFSGRKMLDQVLSNSFDHVIQWHGSGLFLIRVRQGGQDFATRVYR